MKGLAMINNQEYITTELKKTLEKMIILSSKRLQNLIYIVLGIITAKSVVLSEIAQELKDCYSTGTENSKIKRIYRFFSNDKINPEFIYYHFVYHLMKKYIKRSDSNKLIIIFDHTTIEDRFLILQFSLKVGKRTIPLWNKTFNYVEDDNKNFKHVKEGLKDIYKILNPYKYDVIVLADRGFKSIDLFEFIDKKLGWKYCIRCTNDILVEISGNEKVKKLKDISPRKRRTKHLNNVLLTAKKYLCNLAVCKADEESDTWYIISNFDSRYAINEYKKRFDIEEMFRDMKSNGLNMEDTWTEDLVYFKNLYLCICIAYTWIVILGASCSKNKKSKIIGVTRRKGSKIVRVYSLFKSGMKWFKRCYNSNRKKYCLSFSFALYDI